MKTVFKKQSLKDSSKQTARKRSCLLIAFLFFGLAVSISDCFAQHQSDIEAANKKGDYFDALITLDKVAKRKLTTDSHLAAAKSAWALSLPERALSEFDQAGKIGFLDSIQEREVRFSKAIIHFQENRADEALMISQKLMEEIEQPSEFRARVLTLIAQSLIRMGSKAQAEEKLLQAFTEASYLERSDIAYQLADLQNQLGKWEEAKLYLKTINFEEAQLPEALKLLIQICLSRKEYPEAESLLAKAKETFSDSFDASWIYYVEGILATQNGDKKRVDEIVQVAEEKLSPSDTWLTLLKAEKEAFLAAPLRARMQNIPTKEGL